MTQCGGFYSDYKYCISCYLLLVLDNIWKNLELISATNRWLQKYTQEIFVKINVAHTYFYLLIIDFIVNMDQSTFCAQSSGPKSWSARSSLCLHTQQFAEGNAPWPRLHSSPPAAPPAGRTCSLRRWALGCPSAAWGWRAWSAGGSGSAGTGTLGYRCPKKCIYLNILSFRNMHHESRNDSISQFEHKQMFPTRNRWKQRLSLLPMT